MPASSLTPRKMPTFAENSAKGQLPGLIRAKNRKKQPRKVRSSARVNVGTVTRCAMTREQRKRARETQHTIAASKLAAEFGCSVTAVERCRRGETFPAEWAEWDEQQKH